MRRRTDFRSNRTAYCPMTDPNAGSRNAPPGTSTAALGRRNRLLAALPGAEYRALIARCDPVELAFGEVLCEAGERIRHVYFPLSGFISLISSLHEGPRLEVGLVGAEGMLGAPIALGVPVASLHALVQGSGSALRVSTSEFVRQLERSMALRNVLNRYLYVRIGQLAQMAACARFHLVDARLARWVLMTRDRANSDTFRLTQEFMAMMLGVRRAGITKAAGTLQERGLIAYSRGSMAILDGPGLEVASCSCYASGLELYAARLGRREPA